MAAPARGILGCHRRLPTAHPPTLPIPTLLGRTHPEPLTDDIEHDERGIGHIGRSADSRLHVRFALDDDLHRSRLPRIVVPAGHLPRQIRPDPAQLTILQKLLGPEPKLGDPVDVFVLGRGRIVS